MFVQPLNKFISISKSLHTNMVNSVANTVDFDSLFAKIQIHSINNLHVYFIKGLRALRGKNDPYRKWFISSYVVAYVILITK